MTQNANNYRFVRSADGAITSFNAPAAGTGTSTATGYPLGTIALSINDDGVIARYYIAPAGARLMSWYHDLTERPSVAPKVDLMTLCGEFQAAATLFPSADSQVNDGIPHGLCLRARE